MMLARVLKIHGTLGWKHIIVILLPFIFIYIFIFLDTEGLSGVKTTLTSAWRSTNSPPRMPASAPLTDTDEYIAICVAVKDQHEDLREFLLHHYYHMGIRRFYLMDDGSQPPLSSIHDYGIPSTALTHTYFDAATTQGAIMQPLIYNECVAHWRDNHTWMAFIDADEFLHTPGAETLPQILRSFEPDPSIGALAINWRTHTSQGLQRRPDSARKAFTTCIVDESAPNGVESDNLHIKSIVRLSAYVDPESPHSFHLRDDALTVGEHGDVVQHPPRRRPITRDRVALHHYAVKSREEFQQKIDRSNANRVAKDWTWWDHIESEMPHVECLEMSLYDP